MPINHLLQVNIILAHICEFCAMQIISHNSTVPRVLVISHGFSLYLNGTLLFI